MSTRASPKTSCRRYWMRSPKLTRMTASACSAMTTSSSSTSAPAAIGISAAATSESAMASLRVSARQNMRGDPAASRCTGSEAAVGGAVLAGPGLQDRGERAVGVDVAAPRAVLQLGHRVQELWRVHLLVRIRLEARSVAARAVRLVGGERPGCRFAVRGVAIHAGDARVVRLVVRREMSVRLCRRPGARRVACIAGACRYEVAGRLAAGAGAVMARGAGSRRDARVAEGGRQPGGGAMAGVAGRGGGHVIGRLAASAGAVMAR